MYVQGIHVESNNQTALGYFRRGVEKGNSIALNGLGFMYMYGMGVSQSYGEAYMLFTQAALQGSHEALFNLGVLNLGGYGVPKNYEAAFDYFTAARTFGDPTLATYNSAVMLPGHNGLGTARSCPAALRLVKSVVPVERGEWAARLQRGYTLYRSGDVDRALLTYWELIELGLELAQANAAHILDEERTAFTRGRKERALRAYTLSAQQGNMASELRVGDFHYYGWGTPINARAAAAHYGAAGDSEAGIAQAVFNLGWMHEHGRGVARDRRLAKRLYEMVAAAAAEPGAAWPAGICLARVWPGLLDVAAGVLEQVDTAAFDATLLLGRYGVRVPPSAVWLPMAVEYWDVALGGVLLALLAAVSCLREYLAAHRLTRPAPV